MKWNYHKTSNRSRVLDTQVTGLVVTEVQSTSFGLVLHAQHIFQILLIFSSPDGCRLQFSIPCAYFVCKIWYSTR